MNSSCFIIVLFAVLSISIAESTSSEHSRGETGGGSQKRDCEDCHSSRCHQHSDCYSHHCSSNQGQFCSHGQCHCRECLNHTDCSHHCHAHQSFYCSSSGVCHCGALGISISESISSKHSRRGTGGGSQKGGCGKDGEDGGFHGCHQHSDCHSHHCSNNEMPFCSQGQCHCKECLYHLDCSYHCHTYQPFYCSSFGQCHCGDIHCQYDSQCNHHCRAGETIMCLNGTCSCIDPILVDPQLLITCTTHTECSSHVCPVAKHPYCSFGRRSTDCQCTVCTDDSHCSCPAGLVGKCHFNYFDRSYSCTCGFAPDTTTQPKERTTVPPTTAQRGTTTTQQTTLALGLTCPSQCDTNLTCVWDQVCSPGEVCMLRQYHNSPFIVHCSKSDDCKFMKMVVGAEITCCEHLQCVTNILH